MPLHGVFDEKIQKEVFLGGSGGKEGIINYFWFDLFSKNLDKLTFGLDFSVYRPGLP